MYRRFFAAGHAFFVENDEKLSSLKAQAKDFRSKCLPGKVKRKQSVWLGDEMGGVDEPDTVYSKNRLIIACLWCSI